jgi:hypothetical protein
MLTGLPCETARLTPYTLTHFDQTAIFEFHSPSVLVTLSVVESTETDTAEIVQTAELTVF